MNSPTNAIYNTIMHPARENLSYDLWSNHKNMIWSQQHRDLSFIKLRKKMYTDTHTHKEIEREKGRYIYIAKTKSGKLLWKYKRESKYKTPKEIKRWEILNYNNKKRFLFTRIWMTGIIASIIKTLWDPSHSNKWITSIIHISTTTSSSIHKHSLPHKTHLPNSLKNQSANANKQK